MLSTSELKKGMAVIHNNTPWVVTDYQHVKPGKGNAFVRLKIKNITSGNVLDLTFKAGNTTLEQADVTRRKLQYLYDNGSHCVFMDDNYEQYELDPVVLGEKKIYLIEEVKVDGVFLDENLIDINLPKKMIFKVVMAPPGIKGDSAGSVTKQVELENGDKVNTPLFIKDGDKIVINTETGEYIERSSE